MMKIFLLCAVSIVCLATFVQCSDNNDGEPHTYTISFFQFDPKDIGAGENSHKKSKKDIKPSDLTSNATFSNGTVAKNATNTGKEETEQPSHKHWNTTQDSKEQKDSNKTEKVTAAEEKKTKEDGTKIEDNTAAKQSNSEKTNAKETSTNNQKSDIKKDTTLKVNSTVAENNTITKNTTNITPSNSTLNNTTSSKNVTAPERRSKIKHSHAVKKYSSNAQKKFSLNPNPTPSETQADMFLKSPMHKSHGQAKPEVSQDAPLFQKNDSKNIQTDHHASLTEKSVTLRKNGAAKENSTQSERKPMKENSNSKHEKEAVEDKKDAKHEKNSSSSKGQNVVVKKVDENEKSSVKNSTKENSETTASINKTAAKVLKLEKDKKINKNIQDEAKKILPVENSFTNFTNNSTFQNFSSPLLENTTHATDNTTAPVLEKKFKLHSAPKSYNYVEDEDDDAKDKIAKHRKLLSHFIPVYNLNPQERSMGFQLGSLKHPRHDLYPKCHHCPKNSTYTRCVKKKTLKTCKQGLNNICYSKSVKRHGTITYQMGCTDHKRCSSAKAFPCKDGNQKCFTCCQFDRCNSSPHQGDYEMDELNMDELELNSDPVKNIARNLKSNWFNQVCITVISMFFVKMLTS